MFERERERARDREEGGREGGRAGGREKERTKDVGHVGLPCVQRGAQHHWYQSHLRLV